MKPFDKDNERKKTDETHHKLEHIIGLGDRSVRKNYYRQMKSNSEHLTRFKALLDNTSDCVVLISLPDMIITDINKATADLFSGGQPLALVGRHYKHLNIKNNELENFLSQNNHIPPNKDRINHVSEVYLDKENIWLEISISIAELERQSYIVIVGRDITERKQQNDIVQKLLNEKEALLDNALVGLVWIKERKIISCNKRFEEMLGYKPGEVISKSTRIIYESDEVYNGFGSEAYRKLAMGQNYTGRIRLMTASGDSLWCELTGNAIDAENPQDGSVWIFNDISNHMETEERAVFLSHYDPLTKLPNHQLITDRLNQAIFYADLHQHMIGFINIDLDHFKGFVDLFGYTESNNLLIQVAERLKASVGDKATICRQSGDEFLVLLPDLSDSESCFKVLSKIMNCFQSEFVIHNEKVTLSSSIGVAFYPQDGKNFESLIANSDAAMYEAKHDGRNTYRFFRNEINETAKAQLRLTHALNKVLELNQLEVYYQPFWNCANKKIIGAEALLRWNHPELGQVSPVEFIPITEKNGLIIPIGEWVLRQACIEVKKWEELGIVDPIVAVNLSPVQFSNSQIEETIYQTIMDTKINPEMLELEITESIMIGDTENVLQKVKRLKQMGCKLSIDDFGTGYSSLAYLKRFAVDKLKIDQTFIKDLDSNHEDAVIVKTIIHMAKGLGLKTIAEGIESESILKLLNLYHCDEAQGYYIAKPMPKEKFYQFIKENT